MRISKGEVSLETALRRAGVTRDEEAALRADLGATNAWSGRPATERHQVARRAAEKLNHVSPLTGVSVFRE